jgi:hypothetical protein
MTKQRALIYLIRSTELIKFGYNNFETDLEILRELGFHPSEDLTHYLCFRGPEHYHTFLREEENVYGRGNIPLRNQVMSQLIRAASQYSQRFAGKQVYALTDDNGFRRVNDTFRGLSYRTQKVWSNED